MWGQIEGTPKISIAREVLGSVLTDLPSDLSLGLMAYGHREKGNCSDIELIIAPAPGSAAEIVGTAEGISPKGKTPLSAAVRMAAEQLRYTEDKATVILITDGLERDPDDTLEFEMDRLHRSCRRLIWLNPLLRYDGFEPKSHGIRAILPHVDDFRPVHSLESLVHLAKILSEPGPRRNPGMSKWMEAAA